MKTRKIPAHNAVVRKRAAKARRIVAANYDKEDIETSVMDCLADIMHLCDVRELNLHELLDRAEGHRRAERLGIE